MLKTVKQYNIFMDNEYLCLMGSFGLLPFHAA